MTEATLSCLFFYSVCASFGQADTRWWNVSSFCPHNRYFESISRSSMSCMINQGPGACSCATIMRRSVSFKNPYTSHWTDSTGTTMYSVSHMNCPLCFFSFHFWIIFGSNSLTVRGLRLITLRYSFLLGILHTPICISFSQTLYQFTFTLTHWLFNVHKVFSAMFYLLIQSVNITTPVECSVDDNHFSVLLVNLLKFN